MMVKFFRANNYKVESLRVILEPSKSNIFQKKCFLSKFNKIFYFWDVYFEKGGDLK